MTLRSAKERVVQTFFFEVGGVTLISPAYAYLANASVAGSFSLIALLSVVIMIWAPIYNTLFDYVEREFTGRLASDRLQGSRILHAILHEVTSVTITCPLLIWVGGYTFVSALLINVGLTLTYVIYTYVFHMLYDRYRPV